MTLVSNRLLLHPITPGRVAAALRGVPI